MKLCAYRTYNSNQPWAAYSITRNNCSNLSGAVREPAYDQSELVSPLVF